MGAKEEKSIGTKKETQNKKEKMIVDVIAILLIKKKKKKKSKLTITTNKEITKISLAQKGNPSEVVEASSILNEIGGKNVEICGEVMENPLIPIVEEIETKLIEDINRKPLFLNQNVSRCDYNYVATRFLKKIQLNNGNYQ
jgi:spore maturation protein CgeB